MSEYFRQRLFKSLNVPFSRMDPHSGFMLGRSSEISREELKFSKFVNKLRNRFTLLFDDLLSTQLRLKNIANQQDWLEIRNDISYDFRSDSQFVELKNIEIENERIGLLNNIEPYVGKYFSKKYVEKNVLMRTDEEIDEIKKSN